MLELRYGTLRAPLPRRLRATKWPFLLVEVKQVARRQLDALP